MKLIRLFPCLQRDEVGIYYFSRGSLGRLVPRRVDPRHLRFRYVSGEALDELDNAT